MTGLKESIIRKLRKKLRQIEKLERQNRELDKDEEAKVNKKSEIRQQLQRLLMTKPDPAVALDSLEDSGLKPESLEEEEDNFVDEDADNISDTEHAAVMQKRRLEDVNVGGGGDNAASEGFAMQLENETTPPKRPKPEEPGAPSDWKCQRDKHIRALRKKWRSYRFQVETLEGHNDLVTSVSTDGTSLLTGSRDTMVKLWNLTSGLEERSFGGHTGPVTSVLILSKKQSAKIVERFHLQDSSTQLGISGSHDCNIKIWALNTGEALKSMYAYSPVTALAFLDKTEVVISGSGGGKLEVWNPVEGATVQSILAHDEAITSIQISGDHICSASADGVIKVFDVREDTLYLIFESENVKTKSGVSVLWRPIHCLAIHTNVLYYGDDGMNIKALDWKQGVVHKLSNHVTEFGSTDALVTSERLLLSVGYDLDSGNGYVNVRCLPDEKYLCTLNDEDTSRIVCLTWAETSDHRLSIVTGGIELKIWRLLRAGENPSSTAEVVQAEYVGHYDRPAKHSDIESDEELTDNSDREGAFEEDSEEQEGLGGGQSEDTQSGGWLSWCNIL